MGKQHVIARLRPIKDDDIRSAMSQLPVYYDEADIVREALRQLLFGHTGREPLIRGVQLSKVETTTDFKTTEQAVNEDVILHNSDDDDDLDAKLNDFLAT